MSNYLADKSIPLNVRTHISDLALEIAESLLRREKLRRLANEQDDLHECRRLREDAAEALDEAKGFFKRISFFASEENL